MALYATSFILVLIKALRWDISMILDYTFSSSHLTSYTVAGEDCLPPRTTVGSMPNGSPTAMQHFS